MQPELRHELLHDGLGWGLEPSHGLDDELQAPLAIDDLHIDAAVLDPAPARQLRAAARDLPEAPPGQFHLQGILVLRSARER